MIFKRFIRITACLLACVGILSVMTAPTEALNATGSIFDTNLIPTAPEATLDNNAVLKDGCMVSKVHRSNSFGSLVIGCFKDGTKLTVQGTKGSFYKIDCYDMIGYIAKDQVRVTENGEYFVQCVEDSEETTYLASYTMQQTLTLRQAVLEESQKYLGVRYTSGGTTPRGFDCSGYTQYVFAQLGIEILRQERGQMENSIIIPKEEMQVGDLVIFSNTGDNGGFASHVGIYIGNNQVIHASSSKGITISDLDSYYYARHYQCSRRILLAQEAPAVSIPVSGIIQNTGASFWRESSESESPFLTN